MSNAHVNASLKWLAAGVLGLFLLTGCAHNYVVTLNSGVRIDTTSKPRRDGANYRFKIASGQEVLLPAARVREIAPASMAREETFTPPSSR